MTKPRITIIGLGLTGTSIGLGLQREEGNFEIVGHDKRPPAGQEARKLGAVQRTEWNLHQACDGAELLILAIPLSEIEETLALVAEDLAPGSLVLANVTVMQHAIAAADKHLPEGVHFVAGHPVVSVVGALSPRADLFEETVYCLAPSTQTDPSAVQLASDFIMRLGAKPFYVDAAEHDGIVAGVEHLPMLLSAAVMRSNTESTSWTEAKKLAGRRFARSTDVGASAEQIAGSLLSNRENLARHITRMQEELAEWQRLLAADEPDDGAHPLLTAIDKIVDDRILWEDQAHLRNWEESVTTDASEAGRGFLSQMFFGNLGKKRRAPKSDE